jgi:hypothetical protein
MLPCYMLSLQSRHPLTSSPDFSSLCVSAFTPLSRLFIGQSSAPRFSTIRPFRSPSHRSFCGFSPNLQTFQHANLPTFPCRLFSSKPFRIRISKKYARKSHRIRTSKTQDLKPFRICIYEKTPGGWGWHRIQSVRFKGNKLGSAGGESAIASNSGYCTRKGSGTFTLERFKMLINWRALTTPLPW